MEPGNQLSVGAMAEYGGQVGILLTEHRGIRGFGGDRRSAVFDVGFDSRTEVREYQLRTDPYMEDRHLHWIRETAPSDSTRTAI